MSSLHEAVSQIDVFSSWSCVTCLLSTKLHSAMTMILHGVLSFDDTPEIQHRLIMMTYLFNDTLQNKFLLGILALENIFFMRKKKLAYIWGLYWNWLCVRLHYTKWNFISDIFIMMMYLINDALNFFFLLGILALKIFLWEWLTVGGCSETGCVLGCTTPNEISSVID